MAEEREVPVGEPAQQVRDVVRAGDREASARAVAPPSRPSASSRSASARAWRAMAGASWTTSRTSCSTPARSASQAGGGRAAEVDVDPRLGDRPGGRGGRVGVGQDACSSPSGVALDDDDGMDDPPGLAAGPADRGEDRLDQVGHVVGDDLDGPPPACSARAASSRRRISSCPGARCRASRRCARAAARRIGPGSPGAAASGVWRR